MIVALPMALLAMSNSALPAAEMELSPVYVNEHLGALDGKVVRVRGWLGCTGWGCLLYPHPHAAISGDLHGLSLDVDPRRDDRFHLRKSIGHRVLIEGKVDDVCSRADTICLDWAENLHVMRVIAPAAF